jgi:hypothetical protein
VEGRYNEFCFHVDWGNDFDVGSQVHHSRSGYSSLIWNVFDPPPYHCADHWMDILSIYLRLRNSQVYCKTGRVPDGVLSCLWNL